MHPKFDFNFFSFSFSVIAYNFFFWVAVLTVFLGSYFMATRKMGFARKKVVVLLLVVVASAIVGARLLNVLVNWSFYQENPARLWAFKIQGFSIFGGALAAPVGYFCSRFLKIDSWKMGDAIVPPLALGIALMRAGCFLNGCCFGKPTNLPWGVVFPELGRAHLHQIANNPLGMMGSAAVHPTQIYEMLAALIGGAVAHWMINRKMFSGSALLFFGIYFSIFRFLNNFLRVMPDTFSAPEWLYPSVYLVFAFGLLALYCHRRKAVD